MDAPRFARAEESTLEYWEKIDAFKRSLELNKDKPKYSFYDGCVVLLRQHNFFFFFFFSNSCSSVFIWAIAPSLNTPVSYFFSLFFATIVLRLQLDCLTMGTFWPALSKQVSNILLFVRVDSILSTRQFLNGHVHATIDVIASANRFVLSHKLCLVLYFRNC